MVSNPNIYGFADHIVDGRVALTTVSNELVAMTYSRLDSRDGELVVKMVDLSGVTPVLQSSVSTFMPTNGPSTVEVYEASMNWTGESLFVLNMEKDTSFGTIYNIVTMDMANLVSGSFTIRHSPHVVLINSVDRFATIDFIASGTDGGVMQNIIIGDPVSSPQCLIERPVSGVNTITPVNIVPRFNCLTFDWEGNSKGLLMNTYMVGGSGEIYIKCQ